MLNNFCWQLVFFETESRQTDKQTDRQVLTFVIIGSELIKEKSRQLILLLLNMKKGTKLVTTYQDLIFINLKCQSYNLIDMSVSHYLRFGLFNE